MNESVRPAEIWTSGNGTNTADANHIQGGGASRIQSDIPGCFPGASREKPRFMALAEAVLRQVTDLMALTENIQSGVSFASAEGCSWTRLRRASACRGNPA